jgi:hypothetical protein
MGLLKKLFGGVSDSWAGLDKKPAPKKKGASPTGAVGSKVRDVTNRKKKRMKEIMDSMDN